jgi:hypothetical protein
LIKSYLVLLRTCTNVAEKTPVFPKQVVQNAKTGSNSFAALRSISQLAWRKVRFVLIVFRLIQSKSSLKMPYIRNIVVLSSFHDLVRSLLEMGGSIMAGVFLLLYEDCYLEH